MNREAVRIAEGKAGSILMDWQAPGAASAQVTLTDAATGNAIATRPGDLRGAETRMSTDGHTGYVLSDSALTAVNAAGGWRINRAQLTGVSFAGLGSRRQSRTGERWLRLDRPSHRPADR